MTNRTKKIKMLRWQTTVTFWWVSNYVLWWKKYAC